MSTSSRSRIILHCDLDAFYPSCEIHRDPSLKGKPLIVGADPKNGKGRGVVTSCSYEARKFGVRSGMPISMAWKLCPQGIYVPPDFELYGETSERVMNIMRDFADIFEQTSIDEAYMDVSKRCKTYDDAKLLASKLKEALKEREGLTVSVGYSKQVHFEDGLGHAEARRAYRGSAKQVDKFLEPLQSIGSAVWEKDD